MTEFSYKVADKLLAEMIQRDLHEFAADWQKEGTIGYQEPLAAFCDVMLRGGKRLRGMLAMQSYYAHGGKDEAVALGAARVFEVLQTSLLVIDDIADRSHLRRGGPAAHILLKTYAEQHKMKGGAYHFGVSQAMNVAYAGLHKATTELLSLPVTDEAARSACKRLHENILMTINGQIDDIFNEATRGEVSEAMIENVLEHKTPYYTILGPLELGAQLAGRRLSPALHSYALSAGGAYQTADDIISTFGREDETGKGADDDIKEGKMTLIAYFALQHANALQKEILQSVLGNHQATDDECNTVRAIFRQTGAYTYAKDRGREYEEKALLALEEVSGVNSEFIEYLRKFTDYIVNRQT